MEFKQQLIKAVTRNFPIHHVNRQKDVSRCLLPNSHVITAALAWFGGTWRCEPCSLIE